MFCFKILELAKEQARLQLRDLLQNKYIDLELSTSTLPPSTEATRQILTNSTISLNLTKSDQIKQQILQYNKLQTILNENKFDPLQNDSIVIVVQVHNRAIYLKQLISSFSQAQNISNTLIIFSHDIYDDELNKLVQSIDFCKVLQVKS